LNLTNIGSVKCKAQKCDRCFQLQQTYHKIFTTGWGFETT